MSERDVPPVCETCDGDGYVDIVDDWGGVIGPAPCPNCSSEDPLEAIERAGGERLPPPSGQAVSPFECPRCGAVSHHPDDARFEWCGRCEAFTARAPLPEGWRWVPFVGGSHDGDVLPLPWPLEQGDTYEALGTGEVWTWQGRVFRLAVG